MSLPVHFAAVVSAIVRHDRDTATYELRYEQRRPKFRPGQFVHLALDEYSPSQHWPESRVFSIASAPARREGLRLTIGRQGAFTGRVLDEVQVGRRLWLKGPYGEFVLCAAPAGESLVLVAGGTGITPFCSLLDEWTLGGEKPATPTVLHYGARAPELLVYRDLVEACGRDMPGFSATYYAETGSAAGTVPGRIDLERVLASCPDPAKARFFLSGPRAMIDSFREALLRRGATSPERILSDDWQ